MRAGGWETRLKWRGCGVRGKLKGVGGENGSIADTQIWVL